MCATIAAMFQHNMKTGARFPGTRLDLVPTISNQCGHQHATLAHINCPAFRSGPEWKWIEHHHHATFIVSKDSFTIVLSRYMTSITHVFLLFFIQLVR